MFSLSDYFRGHDLDGPSKRRQIGEWLRPWSYEDWVKSSFQSRARSLSVYFAPIFTDYAHEQYIFDSAREQISDFVRALYRVPPGSQCEACGSRVNLQLCCKCKAQVVCGHDCQRKLWKDHKKSCKLGLLGLNSNAFIIHLCEAMASHKKVSAQEVFCSWASTRA